MILDLYDKYDIIIKNLEKPKKRIEELSSSLISKKKIEIQPGINFQGDYINSKRQGFGKSI